MNAQSNKGTINGLPMKPIEINCQTCRGRKKVLADFTSLEDMRTTEQEEITCPDCKGTGSYFVKNL